MNRKRLLSGMRPTGDLHLGHLVGALQNWKKLQDEYVCYYMIADWHALMSEYKNPEIIKKYSLENVADWLACGIDPEKSTIFIQSSIPEHLELAMILSCITPLGWLERCPTYKEQLKELANKEITNYAFLGYPVLQAADILLYRSEFVPVGEDQLPHIELAREIARRFHTIFKCKLFPEPQAKLTEIPRLQGIDGRKMSKSYGNTISLSANDEEIKSKCQNMFTDPLRIKRSDPGHPNTCNLYPYHQVFSDTQLSQQIYKDCIDSKIGCTDCKRILADKLIEFISPIREKRNKFLSDIKKLQDIISEGNKKAKDTASKLMAEVREVVFR